MQVVSKFVFVWAYNPSGILRLVDEDLKVPCCWKKRSYDLWYMWQMYVNMIWYTATFLLVMFIPLHFLRCGVFSLSVKLGWNLGVKFNHKIVPNYLQDGVWYPWKLSMKILTTLRTNATNRWSTPRWESTLHLHPRRDTSGGANPKTLEEVWHQTSSKNWTYTSSNEGVTQVRFPNSKYLNLKMVSYFLLEMPFSMVKPKKDQQQKKEKTETVR